MEGLEEYYFIVEGLVDWMIEKKIWNKFAEIQFAYFKALQKAGFTENQALDVLCNSDIVSKK